MRAVRILIISGSLGDGRCGVGDFAFHLASAMSRTSHRGARNDGAMRDGANVGAAGSRPKERPGLGAVQGAMGAMVRGITATRADAIAARHSGSIAQAAGGASIWTAPDCDFVVRTGFDFGMAHARDLRAAIADERPDAILVQYPSKGYGHTLSIPLIGYLYASRVPYVVTVHEYRDANPLRKIAIRALVSRAARVITPCPFEAAALERVAKCDVTVIPDGNVFALEIDEARYGAMKRELDALSSGAARFAWLVANADEFGEPNAVGDKTVGAAGSRPSDDINANIGALPAPPTFDTTELMKALDFATGHSKCLFTYGFIAKSKAPMQLLEVLSQVFERQPDVRLIIASSIDMSNRLHASFSRCLGAFGDVAIVTGSLPPYILRYIAEKCRLQLYTFKDGYTTKRSSVISALSFATPILTECPIGSRELPLDSVEAGDCEAMARRAAHVLAMDDDEYAEYRSERLAAHAHYAKSLSFETIAVEYIDAVSDAIRA
jgi:glycosyltransferase involved in cell wall biosynthesis